MVILRTRTGEAQRILNEHIMRRTVRAYASLPLCRVALRCSAVQCSAVQFIASQAHVKLTVVVILLEHANEKSGHGCKADSDMDMIGVDPNIDGKMIRCSLTCLIDESLPHLLQSGSSRDPDVDRRPVPRVPICCVSCVDTKDQIPHS